MPEPTAATTDTVIQDEQASQIAAASLQEQRALARKTKQLQAAMQARTEVQSKMESVERTVKRLRQLKRIGYLIKALALTGTGLGDFIFSLSTLLIWANIELIVFPFFVPGWKQEWWEKLITILLDLLVLLVLLIVIAPVILSIFFAKACTLAPIECVMEFGAELWEIMKKIVF